MFASEFSFGIFGEGIVQGKSVFKLGFVEVVVKPALCQQVFMAADFFDPSILHGDNFVGVHDGGQPVRDNQCGSADHQFVQGILDQLFAFAVQRAGRFVQNQNARVAQKGAGDGEALLLAAGQFGSALPDFRVIAVRQGFNEMMSIARDGCLHDLFIRSAGAAIQNVVFDCAGKQNVVLQHHADRVAKRLHFDFGNVLAVH